MGRDVRPSVRLLTFYSISALIIEPTVLRLHRMILDMSPHNRFVRFFRDFRSRDSKNEVKMSYGFDKIFELME